MILHSIQYYVARLRSSLASETGATAVEYGIMVALIAAIIVGVVGSIGLALQGSFQDVLDAIT